MIVFLFLVLVLLDFIVCSVKENEENLKKLEELRGYVGSVNMD